MVKYIICCFIFCMISSYISADSEFKFQRYTTDDGLPANYALTIYQDHKGFLWFGMRGALCRFDGFNFKSFPIEGSEQIFTRWASSVQEDIYKNLWIGSIGSDALFLYDDDKETVIPFNNKIPLPDSVNERELNVRSLFTDSEGFLWLHSNEGGVRLYNPATDSAFFLPSDPMDPYSIPDARYNFYEDNDGLIWITGTGALSIFDRHTQKCIHYNYFQGQQLVKRSGGNTCIFEDSDKNLWLGFERGGLYMFNKKTRQFQYFFHEQGNPNTIPDNTVYSICEGTKKQIWIGTLNGLCIYNKTTQQFRRIYYDETDQESINSNIIKAVFLDNTGNMWLGTSEGICKLKNQKFRTFRYSSKKNSISQNKVQYIEKIDNENIWFSTPKGIDVFNIKTGVFQYLAGITKNINGLYGPPLNYCTDPGHGVWIGTYQGGLSFYSFKNGLFTHYFSDKIDSTSINGNYITAITIDKNGNVYAGASGLNIYDRATNTFKRILPRNDDTTSLASKTVSKLYFDSKNRLWVCGRNMIDMSKKPKEGKFKHFFSKSTFNTNENIYVYDILEANDNFFWFATSLGLLRYNIATNTLIYYSKKTGLPKSISSLLEDGKHNIWASTNTGLYRIEPDYKSDSVKIKFRKYHKFDGLQGDEFLPDSRCKLNDGSMLFGGMKGFSWFHPDSLKKNPVPPPVAFTALRTSSQEVPIGKEVNGQIILEKSICNAQQIIIDHNNNKFTIEFAALHFEQPRKNLYAYKLKGYDKNWHYTTADERNVDYMNLPGGEYVLHVKATNCDGVWNEEGISLHIKILPPWWQTWWFRITAFIVFIGFFFAFYKYRVSALNKQKLILEQRVMERTFELREANSQLEEKQEEILQQNEEIITVNSQLKIKNEEIEAQKEEIETSRDQLEKAFNNNTLLSEFGQKLTATFDFNEINKMIYNYVNSLMDTSAFGIGIYNGKREIIDFPYFMENGKPIPYFFKSLTNNKSLTVRCFNNKEEIHINDLSTEYKKYFEELPEVPTLNIPSSMIHLPLMVKNKAMGTLTVNSTNKNAYDQSDLTNLRTLASYISIALDNSIAYGLVSRQKEQITGSIVYGQTIQRAMLPSADLIDKEFKNFIMFRPKDIVSGDFYWFAKVETKHALSLFEGKPMHFLAVVDCTGHGVPGAFMSMIGSRLLNEIVNEKHIYDPKEILEHLDTFVINALRQDETQNNDGMDVALIQMTRNKDKIHITFSGAKRPFIYWSKKDNALHIVEGTRRSIGGFHMKKRFSFENKDLMLNPGDAFYLFSDGISDQCNTLRKKFGTKRLIRILNEIAKKEIPEQLSILSNELDEFRGKSPQRDDITLIGIRL